MCEESQHCQRRSYAIIWVKLPCGCNLYSASFYVGEPGRPYAPIPFLQPSFNLFEIYMRLRPLEKIEEQRKAHAILNV